MTPYSGSNMQGTVTNDHDLLVIVAQNVNTLSTDVREVGESVKDMRRALEAMTTRQGDLESRMTNLSGTVQRELFDHVDFKKKSMDEIAALKKKQADTDADLTRWKLYMKVAAVLFSPVYVIILGLATKAVQAWLFGP